MIAVIDYGMGNLQSVCGALEHIGADAVITADPATIAASTRVVLPGVGAFGDAMINLARRGLIDTLRCEVLEKRKPFLGICLGMQLLADSSIEHGFHHGLGWIRGRVKRFEAVDGLKIPHIGWNDVQREPALPLYANLKDEHLTFYFVHSYHFVCDDPRVAVSSCEYGVPFAAALCSGNICATQFHPEKSQDNGLQLLENFVTWTPESTTC
jgi:glutamine amidotransferase